MKGHAISAAETRALYRAFMAGAAASGQRTLDAAFLRFLNHEVERATESGR